uniref:Cytochrome c oxidase assembly protein COX11, mitochondrial n=1 Tax=Syphacia muris TaxID=451379 RepID=A0A0N5AKM9_9BILA
MISKLLVHGLSNYQAVNSVRQKLGILSVRLISGSSRRKFSKHNMLFYTLSIGIGTVGLSFAFVPAYRIFCEKAAYAGTTQVSKKSESISKMKKVEDQLIRVVFDSNVPPSMQWEFKPQQREMYVHPGETALAFYEAYNGTDRPIIGISSYNLYPFQAAFYFTKIQCFCFEEQILYPKERVDLPVFFYIDPEYVNDPQLENMNTVMLSYTFYESKDDLVLPNPFEPKDNKLDESNVERGIRIQKIDAGNLEDKTKK